MPTALESQPETEGGQNASEDGAADQGQKKEPATENLSPSLDKIEAAIRDLIAQERAAQGQGPKDEEIRDLEAQEGMAFWAKLMFWATIAAVILTLAGIVLIRYTLKYTKIAAGHTNKMLIETRKATRAARDAVNEAQAATRAAEDVVEVTRITAERQLRAYVYPVIARIEFIKSGDAQVRLGFKNSGQTPARNVRIRTQWQCTPPANPDFSIENADSVHLPDIAPGEGFTNRHLLDNEHFINLKGHLKSGKLAFFVNGDLKYADVFEEERTTNFRFQLVIDEDLTSTDLDACHEGNSGD